MVENMNKLAVSSWVCKYPDDMFRIFKETDFRSIEWDLDYIPVPLSSQRREKLKREFEESHVLLRYHLPHSTCDVGSKSSKIRRISEEYLQLNLELIGGLGANYAVLHFAQYEDRDLPPLSSLESVIEIAAKHNITIAIENLTIGPTSNPKSLDEILSKSGAELALDVGHAQRTKSLEELVSLFSSRITHVHFYGFEDDCYNHRPFPSDIDALKTARFISRTSRASWWTIEMDNLQNCVQLLTVLRRGNLNNDSEG